MKDNGFQRLPGVAMNLGDAMWSGWLEGYKAIIRTMVPQRGMDEVLDVGCGDGAFLRGVHR